MAIAETTGTYVDGRGDYWFVRIGDRIGDDMTLAEPADTKRGAPENRAEPAVETREAAPEPRKRGGGR